MALPSLRSRHVVTRTTQLAVFFCLWLHLVTASSVFDEINGGIKKLRSDSNGNRGSVDDNLINDSSENMSLFVEARVADNWSKVLNRKDGTEDGSKNVDERSSGSGSFVSDANPENAISYYILPETELQSSRNKELRTRKPRHAEIAHSSGIKEYTTDGGRTRAFLSYHAPPVRRIGSSPSSSSKATTLQSSLGKVNADLQQRLSKMLDPAKSIVNIFVYESPNSSSRTRQPKADPRVHQVTSATNNGGGGQASTGKQYRSVDHQNEVNQNTPIELKGLGKYPSIRKGELVFSKQVNRFSPVLQHLVSDQNDIQESTVLGQQTVDVGDQQHQRHLTNAQHQHSTQQRNSQQNRFNFKIQPQDNNHINHFNSFNDVRKPQIQDSRVHSVSNNQFFQSHPTQNSLPITTAHSSSNIFFNSYPGFSPARTPFQIPPSTPVFIPGLPASSNKRSLGPRFQESFGSRPFQASQTHHRLRPSIPDSFAEATNLGNRISASHLKPSGRSFTEGSSSCGMCEHFDDVTRACVFDPCCPLRLAGFAGVAC